MAQAAEQLPATDQDTEDEGAIVSLNDMSQTERRAISPGAMVMFDDRAYNRAKQLAKILSQSQGFVPAHLAGNIPVCFAVVVNSLTWRLNPFQVALATYSPAKGKIGYEGKLCHAILEASGKIVGGIRYEHYGDWSKVQGKFEKKTGDKGKDYPSPTYTDEDEQGLGVEVSAQIRGEAERRLLRFDLRQAFPRNSTLWALDPKTQICYTAVRRFASTAAASLFMGVPFEDDTFNSIDMQDVTPPRPQRDSFDPDPDSTSIVLQDFVDGSGVVIEGLRSQEWVDAYREQTTGATLDQRQLMKAENEDAARAFYAAGDREPMVCWNEMADALDLDRQQPEETQSENAGAAEGQEPARPGAGSPEGPKNDPQQAPSGDLLDQAGGAPAGEPNAPKKRTRAAAETFLESARGTQRSFVEVAQLEAWLDENEGAMAAIEQDWPDVFTQITTLCNTTRSALS